MTPSFISYNIYHIIISYMINRTDNDSDIGFKKKIISTERRSFELNPEE